MLKPGIVQTAFKIIGRWKLAYRIVKGEPLEEIAGEFISGRMMRLVNRPISTAFYKAHMMAQIKSHRTLLDPVIAEVERDRDGRIVRRMKVIYHDANLAKKHLDVHIGRTSLIYRISGKPVEEKIKFNKDGWLTEDSKKALLDHLRAEIANNSRVAQNLDHTISNAYCNWPMGAKGLIGYGSGPTRQLVAEGDVEFYHHRVRSSEHVYAPLITGSQGTFLYQIYPGNDERETPILVWGKLIPRPVKFEDRLHLTLIQPDQLDKFKEKIDPLTNTRKYDGAATYFHSDTGQGFKFFSPRESKETGYPIEYTYKIPELAEVGHQSNPVGMGELMFWKHTLIGELFSWFCDTRGPEWLCWKYIDASEIGGILNSHQVRPRHIHPELRVYRIDKWSDMRTYDLPFWENRDLQILMTNSLNSNFWKVVSLARPSQNPVSMLWEGFVGVPEGKSVNDGYKLKWWGDENDWQVTKNELYLSDKGNIAGVIWFKSLESGREFKLGPGQIGNFDDNMVLLESGQSIIGMVAKVHGRQGHEGRAAKIVDWHLDKGTVPDYFK